MSVAELKASLPIDRVTVFPQSALIQRRGKLTLSGGETRIGLEGLPCGLTPDSVRVEVEPDQGLVILDVASAERLIDPSLDMEYGKLKDQCDALLDEKKKCAARLANCLSELSLFLEKESLTARAQSGKFLPVNVEGWKEFFAFLRERLTGNRAAYRERLFNLLELEKRIAAASANLARRQAAKDREHEIALRVEAPRAGEYSLSLGYLQEEVFWYPVYAVAGSPEEKSCTVSLSAVIGQSTGEDWSGVELLLSTAVPMFSCSIPVLSSRRLREAAAEMEIRRAAPAGELMKSMKDDEALREAEEAPAERARAPHRAVIDKKSRMQNRKEQFASGPAPAPKMSAAQARPVTVKSEAADYMSPAAPPAPADRPDLHAVVERFEAELGGSAEAFRANPYADALFQVAGSTAFRTPPELQAEEESGLPEWMGRFVSPLESLGGYDYRYSVAGRRDIPSSPVPHKVPVARKALAAEFVYVTVPAVKEAVFLKTLFANEGENPLPSGPAQVFSGDTLIGSLFFSTLGPGEKGEISLGAERDIKVLRRERSSRRRRGVVSREVITDFTVEIELISHKNAPIAVEVYDRLPVSRQPKEIAVGDFRAEPEARVSERKILFWRAGLEPRKKTVIGYRYSIRHPADFRVALEEDPVPFQMGKEK